MLSKVLANADRAPERPARPVEAAQAHGDVPIASHRGFGRRIRAAALALAAVVALSACSALKETDSTASWSAERLYREAKSELDVGGYERAVSLYEKLEARFPFGILAQQAQIDIAYAYYRQGERAQALSAIDRFMKLHPTHPAYDYALYLKGLTQFNDNLGFLSFLSRQDPSERDQQTMRDSFESFKELVQRFPDSRYASDARLRMNYIVNALATYDVQVARYYFRRGAYVAAVNRAQKAVLEYQGAPALEQALYLMVKSYERLGMEPLRADAERVFKLNFPKSDMLVKGLPQSDEPWWKIW
jgi:outer membrane protein assembly factor BamD